MNIQTSAQASHENLLNEIFMTPSAYTMEKPFVTQNSINQLGNDQTDIFAAGCSGYCTHGHCSN